MSGTIESTNNNIVTKINSVCKIVEIFNELNINMCRKTANEISDLKEEYEMGSITILSEYFLNNKKIRKSEGVEKNELLKFKNNYFHQYQIFIRKENIISKLDRVLNVIKNQIEKNTFSKEHLHEIYSLIKEFNNSTIDKNIKEVVYEMCVCSTKMDIDPVCSTLVCKNCGITKELYGTVFEDDQFYYQEGQRTKHGTYDPSKHCRFWVERIQARETTDINESVILKIKKCIKDDKIKNKNQITCNQIRMYLRRTHNSKYNEHVPLIRKIITGIIPPQLSDYEMQLIHIYFDKVIHIFDEIKPPKKTNCPYHPYFIYKIIEQIIKGNNIRKIQILSCIHLQSRDTLVYNDLIWKPICVRIEEFSYIPTDKNDQINDF
jgi:hypothetical protein